MPMNAARRGLRPRLRHVPQAGMAALLLAATVRPASATATEAAPPPQPARRTAFTSGLLGELLHPDALFGLVDATPAVPRRFASLSPAEWAQTTQIVDVLKVPAGARVDDGDLANTAHRLGLTVGQTVDVNDVRDILDDFDNRVGQPLRRLGVDYGKVLDEQDLVDTAHNLGLRVGQQLDLTDIDNIGEIADEHADAKAEAAAIARQRVPFATVRGVTLYPPSRHVRLIGFHQASYRVAQEMSPTGRHGMRTLPSRRRGTPRQSAADVAVVPGTPIYAPVSGTVVEAHHYMLYGKYPDTKIRIVPDDNPGELVTMLHVTGPRVHVGQHVTAKTSQIAAHATFFPFWSQIENTTGRGPHVHVEVRHR